MKIITYINRQSNDEKLLNNQTERLNDFVAFFLIQKKI